MTNFTTKVDLVWKLDFAYNYQFDKYGNCYNVKTGRQLKRTLVGYTEGYCVNNKFKSLGKLRKHLIKVNQDTDCPF